MTKDLFSVEDAAAALGIAPANLRLWIVKGRLRARKIGGRWIILRRDLEAFRAWWKANPKVAAKKKGQSHRS